MEPPVLRRRDLRRLGWSDRRIARELTTGGVARVGHDRYVLPGVLVDREQALAVPGTRTSLSCPSAGRFWRLPIDDDTVCVDVPHGARRRSADFRGVTVRQVTDWDPVVVRGVSVTSPARTVADLLITASEENAVAAADAALHSGLVTLEEVTALLRGRGPGRRRARRLLAWCDARAESALESRLRLLLVRAGMPPDDLQHVVRERGRFVARVDLWYDGAVVEADGFEHHRERADYVSDRRKGQAYARLGLVLLRFSWEDVVVDPDGVVETVRTVLHLRRAAA